MEMLKSRLIKRAEIIQKRLTNASQQYRGHIQNMRKTEASTKLDDNKIDEQIEKLSFQITIYIQRAAKHED